MTTDHHNTIVHFFETLTPNALEGMGDVYDEQAHFSDPFNNVHGLPAIRTIFEHMFIAMQAPRFEVLTVLRDASSGEIFLRWNFYFSKKGLGQHLCIHGSSYLRLSEAGKISYHQDYWDSGKELYEKLPVIGGMVRWLSAQLKTPQKHSNH